MFTDGRKIHMEISYDMLDCDFLCLRLPELADRIIEENERLGSKLPHCLFGNVLDPFTAERLKSSEYKHDRLLKKIFDMYEELAELGDTETKNLLQVTLLEYLWDDYDVFTHALELMGYSTRKINDSIAEYMHYPQPETERRRK